MDEKHNGVAKPEKITQKRIIKLFEDKLGYHNLGNFQYRKNNSNIEVNLLTEYLKTQGYSNIVIKKAIYQLQQATIIGGSRELYDANKDVYHLLRYGVKIKEEQGEQTQTVWLIDWDTASANTFCIAEEVTINGLYDKRPDIVLYINGIALAVLELKRSIISISEGIRQNLLNQQKDYIPNFFTTMQFVMAGNDSEGLKYGTIHTKEKYYLKWKEESENHTYELDQHLALMFNKARFIELLHDFIIFDAGIKKVCRHNQYFGVKNAQESIRKREGGIIWHTQGSGKSITMVWLARWIRENKPNSRVLIVTDRKELDEQIENIFRGVDEDIYRTKSGADLVEKLNSNDKWLICSLIHKFSHHQDDELTDEELARYLDDIRKNIKANFSPKGDIYLFVDECHRTQSNKLHAAMKQLLPHAMLIGFTGTPLLKGNKKTSIEVFGPYIHTYKYDEAITDGVILDLLYEARDVEQRLSSNEKVDQWFEAKTRGKNDYVKAKLRKRWGTIRAVLSSKSRLEKIVNDIVMDMAVRPRLADNRGNAILVSGGIPEACKYYELLQGTELRKHCAIITSYKPSHKDIRDEITGSGNTEKLDQYQTYRKMLADFFDQTEDQAIKRIEEFEIEVKKRFIEEPGRMRLLIVVDKLLTGFDAPSATYLYIDKKMRNHGLFQAICRVNRLDEEDKEYGYIVDYKDSFDSIGSSIQDYTGDAFSGYDREDVEGLLINRLERLRDKLDERRELLLTLCEPVPVPKDTLDYQHYFCSQANKTESQLKEKEIRRHALYKLVGWFTRAYANLAGEMNEAGYSESEVDEIKHDVKYYEKVRREIMMASGDLVDMKAYEPDMRYLIDTYITAEDSRKISDFDNTTLLDLFANKGVDAINALPESIRQNYQAAAEAIENNIRRIITEEYAMNPAYYERMSTLLNALIEQRRAEAREYEQYLQDIANFARNMRRPNAEGQYPKQINTQGLRSLYDNLNKNVDLALKIDEIIKSTRKDGFRDHYFKQLEIEIALKSALENTEFDPTVIFNIIMEPNNGY